MIGANILISIKTLCILPAIVYFLTKNIAQNVFVSLFSNGYGVEGQSPSALAAASETLPFHTKAQEGGLGETLAGGFPQTAFGCRGLCPGLR